MTRLFADDMTPHLTDRHPQFRRAVLDCIDADRSDQKATFCFEALAKAYTMATIQFSNFSQMPTNWLCNDQAYEFAVSENTKSHRLLLCLSLWTPSRNDRFSGRPLRHARLFAGQPAASSERGARTRRDLGCFIQALTTRRGGGT